MPIRNKSLAALAALPVVVFAVVGIFSCAAHAAPVQDHPRLRVRSSDLPVPALDPGDDAPEAAGDTAPWGSQVSTTNHPLRDKAVGASSMCDLRRSAS